MFGPDDKTEEKMANSPSQPRNHRVTWTVAELDYLEAHYATQPPADIASYLGRTTKAIKMMARKLGCTKERPFWSEAEKAVLIQHYASSKSLQEIMALLPGRKLSVMMVTAAKMGLTRPENIWTEKELRCLRRYYPVEGQAILRRLPEKSDEAIRDKARELAILSPGHTRARQWDKQEWLLLRQNRQLSPLKLMAIFPDRSLSSIKNALNRLKRAKTPDGIPLPPVTSKSIVTAWSEEEKNILRRWYETSKPMAEILALLPGRPRSSIFSLAHKMGLSRPRNDWTKAEEQIIRQYYPTEGGKVAHRLPGREALMIGQKAFQMGVATLRQSWSEEEKQRLAQNLSLPFAKLRQLFPNRTLSALKNACLRAKARQKE